ncbi:MAG: GNAT family N-acetyltransferase [Clostridiales bacterium]|nr:GNAT family N-acetyltransferase [Clostridiales bacterium]
MLLHKGTNSIETRRLLLRKFEKNDAKDMFHNWAGDIEVCKYLSWGPHKNIGVTQMRIDSWINQYDYEDTYIWAIEYKNVNQAIGSISVEMNDDRTLSCEIGYCLSKEYWNRGIMTEALRVVMHYLHYEIGYEKIVAKHDILNPASGKVMQKAGMEFEKVLYQTSRRRDGTLCDCAVYAKKNWDEG